MSAYDALMKFSKKNQNLPKVKRAKNSRPEKLVEKDVLKLCEKLGFDMSVVEAKGVYNPSASRYLSGQTEPGFSDLQGCDTLGYALYIELKAPKKLSTLTSNQYLFLERKIRKGAFGCVVDSPDLLSRLYSQWVLLKRDDPSGAMLFLLKELPQPKGLDLDDESELF